MPLIYLTLKQINYSFINLEFKLEYEFEFE